MKKDFVTLSMGLYIVLMSVYWFVGGPDYFWALFYYSLEKSLTAFAFYLLYLHTRSKFMRQVSLYGIALCAFMLIYFMYCFRFGHETYLTVGTFLLYSFVVLIFIRTRT